MDTLWKAPQQCFQQLVESKAVRSAEVVKLADTPSAHRLFLNLPKPKKTTSLFFDFNKL
jgi:hypothetical protein